MLNVNLINEVVVIALDYANLFTAGQQQKFTLDSVPVLRDRVRRDHWNLIVRLSEYDGDGRQIATNVLTKLFQLAFTNIVKAWVSGPDELVLELRDEMTVKIKSPANASEADNELPW